MLAGEGDGVGVDGALVNDPALVARELVDVAKEIGIGDVAGGGVELAHINDGVGAEHDAGGIDEVDDAVGTEVAVDLGRGGAVDAVENAALGGGLNELDGLADHDVELVEINNGIVEGANGGGGRWIGKCRQCRGRHW